jgi:hypothetical protein
MGHQDVEHQDLGQPGRQGRLPHNDRPMAGQARLPDIGVDANGGRV